MQVETGNMKRIALVARTPADARAVMIEGRSGLLNICPPWNRPIYEPSKRKLTWPNAPGGPAEAFIYSSEKPDQLRGPEHDGYWADELAAWRFLDECWDNLMFGLRLNPQDGRSRGVITTTPRPLDILKRMMAQAIEEKNTGDVYLVQGSTLENAAVLPRKRIVDMMEKYHGTRLGDQELYAKILSDSPGALWIRDDIRVVGKLEHDLTRVVIGVDPQKSSQGSKKGGAGAVAETKSKDKSKPNCSTGIVGAARDGRGRGYVLQDFTCDGKPDEWAREVCRAYDMLQADCIIAEANAGGDMVESVIQAIDPTKPVKLVHATRGKKVRAEPISMLYKSGRIFHYGHHPELEDQQCNWDPNTSESPDRVDALVWAFTDLLLGEATFHEDDNREMSGYNSRRW